MKIFISWSGEPSRSIATILRDRLPDLLRQAEPWTSDEDLRKGLQWVPELTAALRASTAAILVLTPQNVREPWIHFEAGAIANAVGKARCCPLLFGLQESELTGPLTQFQATRFETADFLKLVLSLNEACGDHAVEADRLKRWFRTGWNDLVEAVNNAGGAMPQVHPDPNEPVRSQEELLLEEVLRAVRGLARSESIRSTEGNHLRHGGELAGRLLTVETPVVFTCLNCHLKRTLGPGAYRLPLKCDACKVSIMDTELLQALGHRSPDALNLQGPPDSPA